MATETLRPNGAGSETNLDIYAPDTGEANWEDIDEAVADDLTTCLKTPNEAYTRDLYACADSGVGAGTINSVTIHWRVRQPGNGLVTSFASKCAIRTHATTYDGTEKAHAGFGSTWFDESQEYTTNPNTGLAWTWAEVDAMEIGFSFTVSPDATGNCYPTQVYAVVTYTLVTEKASADTGQGTESLPGRAYVLPESGAGSESLGARLLGAVEEGGGTEALLARLLTVAETALGLETGALFFTATDDGSGLDTTAALQALLAGAELGSGTDVASLIKALLSSDSGLGADVVAALLAGVIAGELAVGSDRRVVKVESAPKGGNMKLPPGGRTSIPSRRVNR